MMNEKAVAKPILRCDIWYGGFDETAANGGIIDAALPGFATTSEE